MNYAGASPQRQIEHMLAVSRAREGKIADLELEIRAMRIELDIARDKGKNPNAELISRLANARGEIEDLKFENGRLLAELIELRPAPRLMRLRRWWAQRILGRP